MVVAEVALLKVPEPDVVQVKEVALPPMDPLAVKVLFAQIVELAPAFAVGAWLIVKTIASETEEHGPAGSLVVIVKVTEPAVISAAEGVYVAFDEEALLKVPVPEEDQVRDVAPPPIIPFKVYGLPAQMEAFVPAFAVGAGLIVRTIASLAEAHGPEGSFDVIVNVTEPDEISEAEGVYVAVPEVALLKEPEPELVHVKEVAPPPMLPFRVYVEPEQIVASELAEAVAGWLIVRSIASETAVQDPAGSLVVKVRVTEPAVTSAADGV